MSRSAFERARRLRDANTVVVAVAIASTGVFAPFVALVRGPFTPSEAMLTLSWWTGATVLSGYGVVHLLAAVADTRRFLADYGIEHASAGVVFCHALGQRLLLVIGVGFALAALAVLGTGVGVPVALLVALGLFGALLLGPPTAIPMNRRVSDRLGDYRAG
ncbi:hypothetical protein [Haloplanus halobius]|uniref:hypothetical protein n=1 Tax=Haloplanus halobius TaxID=2934938 RepID=UPI00200F3879|nr:hypothetical protein [Haloplanus sp. XH21]